MKADRAKTRGEVFAKVGKAVGISQRDRGREGDLCGQRVFAAGSIAGAAGSRERMPAAEVPVIEPMQEVGEGLLLPAGKLMDAVEKEHSAVGLEQN